MLSNRLRPDVECAPWVIEEVKRLEQERDKLRAVAFTLRQALKDYYHECRCRHADMDSVNIAAYKALQDAEKLL